MAAALLVEWPAQAPAVEERVAAVADRVAAAVDLADLAADRVAAVDRAAGAVDAGLFAGCASGSIGFLLRTPYAAKWFCYLG